MRVKDYFTATVGKLPLLGLLAGLALGSFLLFQHASLWIQNQKYSSVQLNRPRVERIALAKDEELVELPCVKVKTIQKKNYTNPNSHSNPQGMQSEQIEVLSDPRSVLESVQLIPDYPLLLSRYLVKAPLSSDLVLESWLLADGENRIKPADDQPRVDLDIAELGKIREIGVWLGYEGSQTQGSEYSGRTPPIQWGYSLDISYQQDMFRLFGNWTRLSASVGFQEQQGARVKIAIAPLAFRF